MTIQIAREAKLAARPALPVRRPAWLILAVLLLLAAGLAACGGGGDERDDRTVLESDRAVAASVGSAGGTLSTTGSDGTRYELTVPEGALPGPVQITMTPVRRIAGLPLSGGLAGAVELQPSGLVLARGATLRIGAAPAAPAATELVGFAIDAGATVVQRAVAVRRGSDIVVAVDGFSLHGAGFGSQQDVQSLGWSSYRTDAEGEALVSTLVATLLVSNTTAEDKYEAYLRWYDEVVEPQIVRAQTAEQLYIAVREYADWANDVYEAGIRPEPSLRATWDSWYVGPHDVDSEIGARKEDWYALAGPKLRRAFDDNNALCAAQQSLAALRNAAFFADLAFRWLSDASRLANGLDLDAVRRDLCVRLVVSSLQLADPLRDTVPSDLDVTFGLIFAGQQDAQSNPVRVTFSGVNARFGKASPANSDIQGRFTLAVTAEDANRPVTVFLEGCLVVDGEPLGWLGGWACVSEAVARNGTALQVAGTYTGNATDLSRRSDGTVYNTVFAVKQNVRQSGNRIAISDVRTVNGVDQDAGYGPVFDIAPDGTLTYLGESASRFGFDFILTTELIYQGSLINGRLTYGWRESDYDTCNCASDRLEYQLTRVP